MNRSSHLRTVFVFLEIFSQEGGIQSYVKDVIEAYQNILTASPDARARIMLLRDSPQCDNPFREEQLQFRYFKSKSPWLGRLKLTVALFQCLLQERPQTVYCGHIKLAPLVRWLCQPLGVPYVILTYGKEVWSPLPSSYRRALQQAQAVWTISRYSGDRLCKSNGVDPKRVAILPCVVDGSSFTPGPKPPELVTRYGLAGATVLMTVARLWSGDPYKGVDVTLRALPQILDQYPQVKYLIVGRGDDQPRLAQLAQDLGVESQVVFAGFVPQAQLIAHYRLADAYIMPSQEGFGIVYLEAMACGKPVLSGDTDGSADPLQDGRLGWRVPYRDPAAVATATVEILQGQDQRCNGQWLRQEVLQEFDRSALKSKLQRLLKNRAAG